MKERGRRTITLDSELENKIREIQAQLIHSTGKNWITSTVANMVALAGILSAGRLKEKDFQLVADFLNGNISKIKNTSVKKYVTKIGKQAS